MIGVGVQWTFKMMITDNIEFEWIKDVPTYVTLEPSTIYYFEPNITGSELMGFVEKINPSEIKEGNLFEWLSQFGSDEEIKYFVTDSRMELDGWCDASSYEEARDEMYPRHNFIEGRTL